MLILLCLAVLIILILIFVAAGAPTNSRNSRVNIDRASLAPPRVEAPPSESLFQPAQNTLGRGPGVPSDMFAPISAKPTPVPPPERKQLTTSGQRGGLLVELFRAGKLENLRLPSLSSQPPLMDLAESKFQGQEQPINWDARCRLFGETHRVCSCTECVALRKRHGV